MKKIFLYSCVLFFSLFGVLSCEDDSTNHASPNTDNTCTREQGCEGTLVCVRGQCIERGGPCEDMSDCHSGQECQNNRCKDIEVVVPECASHDDCLGFVIKLDV